MKQENPSEEENERMKRTNRRVALIGLCLAGLAAAVTSMPVRADDFPEGSPKFVTSYKEAVKSAAKEKKPVVMVFSAVWCGPCQMMKKNTYPSDAVKKHHDKFVWAYLDADQEENRELLEKYKVSGIPHVEFVTADGKSLGKQVGYVPPDTFAEKLEAIEKKAAEASDKKADS